MSGLITYRESQSAISVRCSFVIFLACLVLYPLASGLRGISLPAGNAAMFLLDMVLIALFVVSVTTNSVKIPDIVVIVLLLSALVHVISDQSPDLLVVYQGFRKSILWIICISLGARLSARQGIVLINYLFAVCFFVCLYSIKQALMPSDFDRALLSVQAANEYTNRIGDVQRSISILSSAFHVSFAAIVLLTISLCADWYGKIFRFAALACAVAGLYFAHTRTFAIIAILIVALRVLRLNGLKSLVLLAVLLNGALMALTLLGFDVIDYVIELLRGDERFSNRAESYQMFSQYMDGNIIAWLAGHGLGSAGSTLEDGFNLYDYPWIEPHNIFLKYLFEFGYIFGGGALLLLIYIWISGCRQNQNFKLAKMNTYLGITLAISGLTITSVETIPVSLYVGALFGLNYTMRRRHA